MAKGNICKWCGLSVPRTLLITHEYAMHTREFFIARAQDLEAEAVRCRTNAALFQDKPLGRLEPQEQWETIQSMQEGD